MSWARLVHFLRAERAEARWLDVVVALVACGVLAWLAASVPHARFVDFVSFSQRAEGLRRGEHWMHPLYPVGYPLLLSGLQALFGDVLVAGRVISVAAGVGLSVALSRWTSPWLALVVLVQVPVLTYGATEGTDLMAAALAISAVLAGVRGRSWLAGALLGGACMCRYTGIAAAPIVLWLAGWRGLVGFGLATAPHWLGAAVLGVSPWPDQSLNMRIGQGPGGGPAAGPVERFFVGLWQVSHSLKTWPALAGVVGLIVGVWRRDKRAIYLLLYGLLHCAGLALAFGNPRLALPVLVVMGCGWFWLLPRRWLVLALPVLLWWGWPRAREIPGDAVLVAEVQEAAQGMEGPYASSTAWFYSEQGGWLRAPWAIWEAAQPGVLTPEKLHIWCKKVGIRMVVLDRARTRRAPGIQGLSMGKKTEGFELVAKGKGWVLLRVLP